jgi:steroid delta-isomerase-like uncharacterized protein
MKTESTLIASLLAPVAGSLLLLAGCAAAGGSSTAADDSMMQAYEQYKAAWSNHDVPTLVDFHGKSGTYTDPGAGKLSGQAFGQWVGALFTAIPDFKVQLVSADPVDADTLAEQWVITGTWTKPFPGGPLAGAKPSGKSFTVPGASFIDWNGTKIVSENTYYDQMAFLTQIGVIPPPGQSPQASAE